MVDRLPSAVQWFPLGRVILILVFVCLIVQTISEFYGLVPFVVSFNGQLRV